MSEGCLPHTAPRSPGPPAFFCRGKKREGRGQTKGCSRRARARRGPPKEKSGRAGPPPSLLPPPRLAHLGTHAHTHTQKRLFHPSHPLAQRTRPLSQDEGSHDEAQGAGRQDRGDRVPGRRECVWCGVGEGKGERERDAERERKARGLGGWAGGLRRAARACLWGKKKKGGGQEGGPAHPLTLPRPRHLSLSHPPALSSPPPPPPPPPQHAQPRARPSSSTRSTVRQEGGWRGTYARTHTRPVAAPAPSACVATNPPSQQRRPPKSRPGGCRRLVAGPRHQTAADRRLLWPSPCSLAPISPWLSPSLSLPLPLSPPTGESTVYRNRPSLLSPAKDEE